jgi:hypothetical protein
VATLAEVALNILVIMVVAAPLIALEALRPRAKWINDNHDWLNIVMWLGTLFAVYLWVLPRLGLQPNPRFFAY